jgi:hypothetical protein
MQEVKFRLVHSGAQPAANQIGNAGLGRTTGAAPGRLARTPLALHAVH